jgi:hypothetical protein
MTDTVEPKRVQGLSADRLELAEFAANTFRCRPLAETPIENVLAPEYWAHTATKVRSGDTITVLPEDRSYFAELLVLDCGRTWAKVHLLRKHDLKPISRPEVKMDGYTVKWRGPAAKYSVIRDNDKTVLSENHATKEAAMGWLSEHLKVVSA